jgi:pimeloyl-ACP methyl ester carboxylesterase
MIPVEVKQGRIRRFDNVVLWMTAARTDRLRVPGATLYYKVWGSGPLLVVLQGGAGNADASDGIARDLADRFSVVSYDRRGMSRSELDPDAGPPSIETHADDVQHLLCGLTSEPAFVFGTSIGALIGLDLVSRYAEQVRRLVAHEPPSGELLPAAERAGAHGGQEEAEELFRKEGAAAAMRHFVAITGVDLNDREPDSEMAPRTPQPPENTIFFLSHDAPAVRHYRLNVAAVKAQATRIIPAAGRTSRHIWIHRAARGLARELDKELVEFPGGHSGYAMHPRGFAALLAQALVSE